jgi:hypothetical protein
MYFLIYFIISIFKFYVSLKICNRIKLVCFLKFVVRKMYYEMVKSEILVLTRTKKLYVVDANVVMD